MTITNNALTPQSWKNYQAQYDEIDWKDTDLEIDLVKDPHKVPYDPLRTDL